MRSDTLEGYLRTSVTIDTCLPCQVFWFDARESLQLSAVAVLRLFTLVGGQVVKGRPDLHLRSGCPRCQTPLLLTHDFQRNTKFQYWRCGQEHGRLTTFYDFLREKDFIRPLSPQQLADLRGSLQSVTCANCGAPVDLNNNSRCEHCGTPISLLDFHHGERLIAELQQAAARSTAAASSGPDEAHEDERVTHE
jgi:hypothetical protein